MRKLMFKEGVDYGLYLDPETKTELDNYVRMNVAYKSRIVRRILENVMSGIFELPKEESYVGTLADRQGRWVPYIIRFEKYRLEEIQRFAEDNGFYNTQSFMRNAIRANLKELK